jgi:hypothetical protein
LLIALLFGIWAIIPWLDRRAYRDKASPAFSDFGWAAILFLTYLTLMGWDIGARGITNELAAMHNVARVCAWWTLVEGAVVIVVRYWKFGGRWFILSGAALLQVALHGLAGVSYLFSGLIAVAVAAVAIAISYMVRPRAHPSEAT